MTVMRSGMHASEHMSAGASPPVLMTALREDGNKTWIVNIKNDLVYMRARGMPLGAPWTSNTARSSDDRRVSA